MQETQKEFQSKLRRNDMKATEEIAEQALKRSEN